MNRSVKAAITRFDNACRMFGYKGSYNPEDRHLIEREHEMARANLDRQIEKAIREAATKPAFATSA